MLQRNSLSKAHRRNAKPPPTTGIQERMHKRCRKKAASTSRDDALKESNDPQLINRIPFAVTYNPMLKNLHKIFKISNLASVPLKDVLKPFQTPLSLATDMQET